VQRNSLVAQRTVNIYNSANIGFLTGAHRKISVWVHHSAHLNLNTVFFQTVSRSTIPTILKSSRLLTFSISCLIGSTLKSFLIWSKYELRERPAVLFRSIIILCRSLAGCLGACSTVFQVLSYSNRIQ